MEPWGNSHTVNLLAERRNPFCPPALFPRFAMGHTLMSQKFKVIFGALAAAAALGAVQMAAGQAASTASLADRFQAVSEPAGAAGVNRVAKGDREAVPQAANQARTILLKVESLADTSVLVRIPVQKDARNLPLSPSAMKPAGDKARKMTSACEPPVSVLTEVAKLLDPGKCVT